jgi:hypothetical protein
LYNWNTYSKYYTGSGGVYGSGYKSRINSTLIGLASGKINYKKGEFDVNIYSINNNNVKDNIYSYYDTSSKKDVNLPLVGANIYYKFIPRVRDFSINTKKTVLATPSDNILKIFSEIVNSTPLGLSKFIDIKKKDIEYCKSYMTNPIYKYGGHYFQLIESDNKGINTPNDTNTWAYVGHTNTANIIQIGASEAINGNKTIAENERILRTNLTRVLSKELPTLTNSDIIGTNFYMPSYFTYNFSPTRSTTYAFLCTNTNYTGSSTPTAPTVAPQSVPYVNMGSSTETGSKITDGKWFSFSYYDEGLTECYKFHENTSSYANKFKYLWMSKNVRDNNTGEFKSSNWSKPVLISDKSGGIYINNLPNSSSKLYGQIDSALLRYGWIDWSKISGVHHYGSNETYVIPYFDAKIMKWKVVNGNYSASNNEMNSSTTFKTIYNTKEMENISIEKNKLATRTVEYFLGSLTNLLKNEPNIECNYIKVLVLINQK